MPCADDNVDSSLVEQGEDDGEGEGEGEGEGDASQKLCGLWNSVIATAKRGQ